MTRALKHDGGSLARFHLFAITDPPETSPETARAAALVICGRATDAADARLLLEICGLAEYQRGEFTSYSYGRVRQP